MYALNAKCAFQVEKRKQNNSDSEVNKYRFVLNLFNLFAM